MTTETTCASCGWVPPTTSSTATFHGPPLPLSPTPRPVRPSATLSPALSGGQEAAAQRDARRQRQQTEDAEWLAWFAAGKPARPATFAATTADPMADPAFRKMLAATHQGKLAVDDWLKKHPEQAASAR